MAITLHCAGDDRNAIKTAAILDRMQNTNPGLLPCRIDVNSPGGQYSLQRQRNFDSPAERLQVAPAKTPLHCRLSEPSVTKKLRRCNGNLWRAPAKRQLFGRRLVSTPATPPTHRLAGCLSACL